MAVLFSKLKKSIATLRRLRHENRALKAKIAERGPKNRWQRQIRENQRIFRREFSSVSFKVGVGAAFLSLAGYGGVSLLLPHETEEAKLSKNDLESAQEMLDEFVRAFEKEGHISTKDLLGGKVVFESEFRKPKYRVYDKNLALEAVRHSGAPHAYKEYPGPDGQIRNVYVVLPDSYIPHVLGEKPNFSLRIDLFHEFDHVKDRSDMESTKKAALLLSKEYNIPLQEAIDKFQALGYVLCEIKANFRTRDFIAGEKQKFDNYPLDLLKGEDGHLITNMKRVKEVFQIIASSYPKILEPIRRNMIEHIRKEFYNSSPETQIAVNKVLRMENIFQIR